MLRAVLLADLVDSTAFIESFGDARAAVALQRLDLQIRDLLEFTGGRLIDKADGLLAIFERPIQAVDFALRYQQALRHFSSSEGSTLTARVGIHVGEVMTWSNSDHAVAAGAKPLEVEGLAKPVAARLMSLALPGQILISSMAQSLAQRAQAELGERTHRLRWLVHGRYRFKGVPAPLLVHEVGEVGFAPLVEPPSGQKAWRELPVWRRPPVVAAEILLFLLVGGFYAYSVLRSPPAVAFSERDWVVIGDMSNFTADPRLEDSLETAFRIGLEQSRFVNIVPELKVRSALDRMGRGNQTSIDRAIGSEIAIREGARVLLLPTVAEVGGNLRVSVEVVDPNTQATVYAETAEGRGVESLLGSLDTVATNMREKFGESVRDIEAGSKPLPEATTRDLNALRAYSLGQKLRGEGRIEDASGLYEEAIRLDPDFALAYLGLARLRLGAGDDAGYYRLLEKAKSLRSRLTHREMLFLDATLSNYNAAPEALAKWRLLTEMYPDEYQGYYHYSLASWHHSYRYKSALEFLKPALAGRNPRLRSAYYLQGTLQMIEGQYTDSLASFQTYESLGGIGYNRQHAEAFAVLRRYDEAERLLASQKPTRVANNDFPLRATEATFPLDRGRWDEGMTAMEDLLKASAAVTPDTERRTRLTQLSRRAFAPDANLDRDLAAFVSSQAKWIDGPSQIVRIGDTFSLLMAGAIAAENGDSALARKALALGKAPAQASGFPALVNAVGMLEAALLVKEGKPEAAVERLQPLHDGNELYLSHALLMRALAASGRNVEAAREAEWLAKHRGRAYAEFNIDQSLNTANVVQSNLALLSGAEYLVAAKQPERARALLDSFLGAWPNARTTPFLSDRMEKLDAALKPAALARRT
ncbi:MAG: putative peptide modification system cyclase [Gammaproteobacteria bacterium]|nr:putative peptide modification system cyclase [Gammaproteobacteria bacterium]